MANFIYTTGTTWTNSNNDFFSNEIISLYDIENSINTITGTTTAIPFKNPDYKIYRTSGLSSDIKYFPYYKSPIQTTSDTENSTYPYNLDSLNEFTPCSQDNYYWPIFNKIPETQKEIKRQRIRSNLIINIKSRADLIINKNTPENERRAIETLREEITESEFRKYIKYGFVLVNGQSGKTYQIFRNEPHTKVWKGGKIIEEICVRIRDRNIPPTDNIIAFKNIIQIDEKEFRKLGNVYKMNRAA